MLSVRRFKPGDVSVKGSEIGALLSKLTDPDSTTILLNASPGIPGRCYILRSGLAVSSVRNQLRFRHFCGTKLEAFEVGGQFQPLGLQFEDISEVKSVTLSGGSNFSVGLLQVFRCNSDFLRQFRLEPGPKLGGNLHPHEVGNIRRSFLKLRTAAF